MFHIESVEVEGFWGNLVLSTMLHRDVNVIIGKNGTGKTTFMNILYAVLQVDIRLLNTLDFKKVTVRLADQGKNRTISVTRDSQRQSTTDITFVTFKIATKSFRFPLFASEEDRMRYYRRRGLMTEEFRQAKTTMAELVNLTSLSVHRVVNDSARVPDEDYASNRREVKPPIDQRLGQLLSEFTVYQLTLAERGNQISDKFQKDVLTSILFNEDFDTFNPAWENQLELDNQRSELANAYKQLIPDDKNLTAKIDKHFQALSRSLEATPRITGGEALEIDDVLPLPLLRRTQHIINLSLRAEKQKHEVFLPVQKFEINVKDFLSDKDMKISTAGEILIEKNGKRIPVDQLSSGEKQILILLMEALLEKNEFFIFLADEPELSLHIEWQNKVISSLRNLNPRTQIIVATHSPEIAAGWKKNMIAMEDIIT